MGARTGTLFSDFILGFMAFHIFFRPEPPESQGRRHGPISDDGRKCSRLNYDSMVAKLRPGATRSVHATGISKRFAMVGASNERIRPSPGKEENECDLQQYGGCLAV